MKLEIKKSRNKVLYVRVDEETHGKVKTLAEEHEVEMNEIARALMQLGIRRHEEESKNVYLGRAKEDIPQGEPVYSDDVEITEGSL